LEKFFDTSLDDLENPMQTLAPHPPFAQSQFVTDLAERLEQLVDLTDRIVEVRRAIPGRVTFSTSLGIEDQAVLHAIATAPPALNTSIDVFTLDTGRLFPETIDTLAASEAHFGIKIRVVVPERDATEGLVARDGVLGCRSSVTARQACCNVRKVGPLTRALTGASGWITGLRQGQSLGRATVPFASVEPTFGLIKINPLADWSLARLEAYVAAHNIPVNPLHARGFPSIGCQPCTRAIAPGDDIRAGRWWWEHQDGKECGLHNRPSIKFTGSI
jgi:phosphoadenosine phosphosulfate reductase